MAPNAAVEKISIEYDGRIVNARRLTVSSIIPMQLDKAWENIQTPELLQFVAKRMITFRSTEGKFPRKWEVGKTYGAKMWIFGFLPFGGTHYLNILSIDPEHFEISTKEWDQSAKVWNHNVKMKKMQDDSIYYEDSIVIYGGFLTRFITSFAVFFYRHRQKRWQIVARENLKFGA